MTKMVRATITHEIFNDGKNPNMVYYYSKIHGQNGGSITVGTESSGKWFDKLVRVEITIENQSTIIVGKKSIPLDWV